MAQAIREVAWNAANRLAIARRLFQALAAQDPDRVITLRDGSDGRRAKAAIRLENRQAGGGSTSHAERAAMRPNKGPSQGDKIHCDFTGIKRRCGTTYFGLAAFGLGPPLSLGFYAVGAATASWPGRSRSQPSVLASLSVPRTARRDDSRCPSYQATIGICCITRRVGRRPPDPVPLLPNNRAVLCSSNTCRLVRKYLLTL